MSGVSYPILRRDAETARKVEGVLGIGGLVWSDISIQIATDEMCTVTITVMPTAEQFRALVEIALANPLGGM